METKKVRFFTLHSAHTRCTIAQRPSLLGCCIILGALLICGCSHYPEEFQAANDFFSQGDYEASLDRYQQIIANYPPAGDKALFEMGIVYAHSGNEHKDYQKARECFRRLIKEFPESWYRKESELMIFTIDNVINKDGTIAAQRGHISALQQEIKSNETEINSLQLRIDALEQELQLKESEIITLQKESHVSPKGRADRILIEKSARRLTLLAKGQVLKTYQIALGGDPIGAKVRQGDNKTPEGLYVIDGRNRKSRFHRSLHISYPNETDQKRARELGVSPGGDIMIHGIKKGFSWAGDLHREVDWTQGCIAVTDQEIEEIDNVAPNGTIVEIRP